MCPGCGQSICSHKRTRSQSEESLSDKDGNKRSKVGNDSEAQTSRTLTGRGRDPSQDPRASEIGGLVKEAKQCGTGLSPAQLRMIFQSDGPAKAKFLKQPSLAVRHDILTAAARRVNLEPKGETRRPRKQSQNLESTRREDARDRSVPPSAGTSGSAASRRNLSSQGMASNQLFWHVSATEVFFRWKLLGSMAI